MYKALVKIQSTKGNFFIQTIKASFYNNFLFLGTPYLEQFQTTNPRLFTKSQKENATTGK